MPSTKTLDTTNLPCGGDFWSYYEKMKGDPVYVILGSQGSGTNLLSNLLRKVFRFSVVHDRSLIFNAACTIREPYSPQRIRQTVNQVYSSLFPGVIRKRLMLKTYFHQASNYMGIEEHFDRVQITTPNEFAEFFYCYHAFLNDGRFKGIKSDDLWEGIEHLDDVLPRRKSIVLVRDPRDNAISIMNKPFGPCEIYSASRYIQKRMRIYRREADKNPNDSITLHYDTLLKNPETAVLALSSFLEIPVPDGLSQRIKKLGIRSSNREKWRQLSPRELRICESVLSEELQQYDYAVESKSLQPLSWNAVARRRIRDFAHRVPQRINKRVRRFLNS